uniref:Actin-related protein 2/3 complex subunit 5 n=2 Tax=Lepeophtheirus salmonis TaxID=72036 RepID=D3PJR6_LEPSM|nr:Actin-related protein 2/3 complex subunit 5-like protein [Lepeophtheirus salmonis]
MSVNTSSYTFRRVDVDQFNEDNFHDETENGTNINNNNCDSNTNIESDVQNFLNSNKTLDALKLILQTSPVSSSDPLMPLLMRTLLSVKQTQVDGIVKELDTDQRDVLMRYIYKGFEIPSEGSSGHLLIWHEKIYDISGVGSIVRVLTDRKQAQMRTLSS